MTLDEIKTILASQPAAEVLQELAQDQRAGVQKLLAGYYKRQHALELEKDRIFTMYKYERELMAQGYNVLAGVDEAGRGPLAGPLVVAAAILPSHCFIAGLNDSKKLSAKKRDQLYEEVLTKALCVQVEIVPVELIDRLNIYQSTAEGMHTALTALAIKPDAALIDAMPLKKLPFHSISLISGDSLSASIAAASVVAKVTRDRLMAQLDEEYPQYGFLQHKGYGTKDHIEAIYKYGVTCQHRKTYEPVKSILTGGKQGEHSKPY